MTVEACSPSGTEQVSAEATRLLLERMNVPPDGEGGGPRAEDEPWA